MLLANPFLREVRIESVEPEHDDAADLCLRETLASSKIPDQVSDRPGQDRDDPGQQGRKYREE